MPSVRVAKPRSSRRAPPLKDGDYDHEINLVDHAAPASAPEAASPEPPASSGPPTQGPSTARPSTVLDAAVGSSSSSLKAASTSSRGSDSQRSPKSKRRKRLPKRFSRHGKEPESNRPTVHVQEPTPLEGERNHTQERNGITSPRSTKESAIDVLYENERGGFLCGMALFSSRALGNLDPTPWTNSEHKPSPTNITTAQVPDPSWEWAWPEWRINHDNGVDEGGWEYSFMFAKKFSWHGPKWWNSFVRRRAWIRKRVKKDLDGGDPYLLNTEYFTIRPSSEINRSASRASMASSRLTTRSSIPSVSQYSKASAEAFEKPDIDNIDMLMAVLRGARIDREKIEALENFLEHGGEELVHLQHQMHDIMAIFVFQASRRILLARLNETYEETQKELEKNDLGRLQRKANNLKAAIKHADEEVQRLEYWSDVKKLVGEGHATTAADKCKGWDGSWQGVDNSGPVEPGGKNSVDSR